MSSAADLTLGQQLHHLTQQHASGSSSNASNTANTSPTEGLSSNPLRYTNGVMNSANSSASNIRMGAGSPSYDAAGPNRLFSKRAREIQAEEGVAHSQIWGPMSSTTPSSSLRERDTISQDSQQSTFPEPIALQPEFESPVFRRARAGTVPSRFSPVTLTNSSPPPPPTALPTTTRPSPAPSPFKANAPSSIEIPDTSPISVPATTPSVASRLRSGSLNLPPRNPYVNPLFNSVFPTTTWSSTTGTRERNVSTSSNVPSSPAHSSFSREDDASMRTLDYLGLADTPQPTHATLAKSTIDQVVDGQRAAALQPFIGDMSGLQRNLNRFRSYSVNAKEKYAEEEEEEEMHYSNRSGQHTPSAAPGSMMHSAVGAFKSMTSSRPRSRTTGILESPVRSMKGYVTTPSRLDAITNASELQRDYFDVPDLVSQLHLGNSHVRPSSGEGGMMNIIEEGQSHVEGPTRSLWLGNIPASTTISSLIAIFQIYGTVESARVLTHKNCGFVNFERIESAIQSRNLLNGKEIFPGAGPVRIGFAKVQGPPGSNGAPTPNGAYSSASPDPFNHSTNGNGADGSAGARDNNAQQDSRPHANALAAALEVPDLRELKDDILSIVQEFGAEPEDQKKIEKNVLTAIEYNSFKDEIPTIPEPSHNRVHDAPKLRDIRKRIDNNNCSTSDIEEIAMGMLDEIAELSSDYLGNTVVQKLFEFCSEPVKEAMLDRIAPHLAEIGIHKNGTWAGQKIIDVAKTETQMGTIMHHLRPYCIALFMDQYGNYVLQCCLRFGSPYNDFIFETMLGRIWEIAQGRFGARAMRACLESHHANKDQQRVLAAAIALHSVQLASNANGALLLTWFLDTCTFPRRRTVLAPRLVPHLVHLCTHKVAYLTVLKVINQRNEPEARDIILRALFFSPNDKVLEEILSDHACGATLIFKVLTTPFFDENLRSEVVQNVRNVLLRLKAQPAQGYKRLMEEVGLPTRNGGSNNGSNRDNGINGNSNGNGNERHRNNNAQPSAANIQNTQNHQNHQPPNHGRDFQNPYYNGGASAQFDPAAVAAAAAAASLPRAQPMDTTTFMEQLALNNALYNQAQANPMAVPQLQYQAAIMQQAAMRPPGMYAQMGYPAAPAATQDFRGAGQHPQNPMLPPQALFGVPPTFSPLMAQQLMGGYPYAPMNGVQLFSPPQQQHQSQQQLQQGHQQQQQQQQGNGNRRNGRR